MKPFRLVYCLLICVLMLLLSGCHLTISLNDGPIGDDNTSVLPDPPGMDPEPPLDEAQQARQDEVDQYTAQVIYHGATITQAIQLPSGDIIDGLDRTTLPALPYALPALPWTPDALQLPPGVEFGVPDFEQYADLADLVATAAPFERPDFSAYVMGQTDATSIQDYLDRYTVGGAPLASEHRHVGLISSVPNQGALGYMNQFHPRVEEGSFSVMEFAVYCPGTGADAQELIGIVISIDKLNAAGRGGKPRLHIEVALPDTKGGGPDAVYQWDGADGYFKPNPLRRHRPGEIVDVSVLAGKQIEHLMGMFQMPGTGDWWLFYDTDLLGYYPADMFTMLHTGACASAYFGEAARKKPKTFTKWPNTEVGSGQHAVAGPLLTAYVRKPQYVDPTYWYPVDVPQQQSVPYKDAPVDCYTEVLDLNNGYVWLGGLGGYEPKCTAP